MATSQAGGDPDVTTGDAVDEMEHVDGGLDDEHHGDQPWRDDVPAPTGQPFNAFDESTWDISPAAVPWYETKQAVTTTAVAAVAAVTLVVSVVLLVVRGPAAVDEPALVENSSTASSPAPTTPLATAVLTPPPPPPDPPPPADAPVGGPDMSTRRQASPTVRAERTSAKPRLGPLISATPVITARPRP